MADISKDSVADKAQMAEAQTAAAGEAPAQGAARRQHKEPEQPEDGPAKPALTAAQAVSQITAARLIKDHDQPSSTLPFVVAGAMSLLWAAGEFAFLGGYYGINGLSQLGLFELGAAGFALGFPVALIWLVSYVLWRGEKLRLQAAALGRSAIALMRPGQFAKTEAKRLSDAVSVELERLETRFETAIGAAQALEQGVQKQTSALHMATDYTQRAFDKIDGSLEKQTMELENRRRQFLSAGTDIFQDIKTGLSNIDSVLNKASQRISKESGELISQTAALDKITTGLHDSSQQLLSRFSEESLRLETVAEHTVNATRMASDGLARQTSDLDQVLDRLSVRHEALDRLGQDVSQKSESLVNFIDTLTGQVDDSFASAEARAERIGDALSEQARRFAQSVSDSAGWAQSAGQDLDQFLQTRIDTLENQLGGLSENTRRHADETAALIEDMSQQLVSRISDGAAEGADVLAQRIESALATVVAGIGDKAREMEARMEGVLALIRRESDTINEDVLGQSQGLKQTLADNHREMVLALDETSRAIVSSADDFSSSVITIRKAMAAAFDAIKDTTDELNRHLENLPGRAKASVRALQSVLAEQVTSLSRIADIVLKHANPMDISFGEGGKTSSAALFAELSKAEQPMTAVPGPAPQPTAASPDASRPAPQAMADNAAQAREKVPLTQLLSAADKAAAAVTQAPETQAPETQAPETQAPETQAPETQAPETQAPETQALETRAPETQALETRAPEIKTQPASANKTPRLPQTGAGLGGFDFDSQMVHRSALHIMGTLQLLGIDLWRDFDLKNPVTLWRSYHSGDIAGFVKGLGAALKGDIAEQLRTRYNEDRTFRRHVDQYTKHFIVLLDELRRQDQGGDQIGDSLSSQAGRVFLLAMQARGAF